MIEGSGSPAPKRAVTGGEAMKALIVYYSMYGHVHRMRAPSENELVAARFQGKHVATLTAKLGR
jgi:hypothetical protein